MRWAGHVACMGERRGACRVLVRKREGNRPLGRLRLRWENDGLPGSDMGGGGAGPDLFGSGKGRGGGPL